MNRAIFMLTLLHPGIWANAQSIDTAILNANNVSCVLSDEGPLFHNGSGNAAGYEVPKGSGIQAIYAFAPWFAALDSNDSLYVAGSGSVLGNFSAGPIADPNTYGTPAYSNLYEKSIWKVSREEIQYHIQNYNQANYSMPDGILKWPGNGDVTLGVASKLAPFVDLNGNNIYEPNTGEYPDIRGDLAVYIIKNDQRNSQLAQPMEIELHIMAYQFSGSNYLDNTTFINTRVYNRSGRDYQDYRQSWYMDADLGNPQDDYVGSDPSLSLGFVYNGDPYDEDFTWILGYGAATPGLGLACLSHDMSTFASLNSVPGVGQPSTPVGLYNFMNARWQDGVPFVFGGTGYPGTVGATANQHPYHYSGNTAGMPFSWTEADIDGMGQVAGPGDRRILFTIEELDFPVGAAICADFALVFNNDSIGAMNVDLMKQDVQELRNFYANSTDFPCQQGGFSGLMQLTPQELNVQVYPNPSLGEFYLDIDGQADADLEIYDPYGRLVFKDRLTGTVTHLIQTGLPTGIYIVHIEADGLQYSTKIIVE